MDWRGDREWARRGRAQASPRTASPLQRAIDTAIAAEEAQDREHRPRAQIKRR
jgi:hypothetical protein